MDAVPPHSPSHRFSGLPGRLLAGFVWARVPLYCAVAVQLAAGALPLPAQSTAASAVAPASTAAAAPTETLRPVLDRIGETLAGLNVSRWKAPGEVRSVTQRDIDSIQRDLSSTLPPLLSQANTPPPSVASYFAVYRNIDALYDVLLRISETATLAGPQNDVTSLQSGLAGLEAARRDLGDAILKAASGQEQELVNLRTAAAEAAAAEAAAKAAPPTKTVVEDGPAPTSKTTSSAKRKKKPAPPATPASQSAPSQ